MTNHDNRRVEDSLLGKIMYFWPLIIGTGSLLIALGGIMTTIHNIGDRVTIIETWISNERISSAERNNIMGRLTAIEEGHEQRITRIEDEQDGNR